VFRRDSLDGSPHRFDVAGLWGSGNTIIERDLRLQGGGTVYSMWDGRALLGPGRPGAIERYPALVATIALIDHLDRYADLSGDQCGVWLGDEELGIGCDEACADIGERCADRAEAECLVICAEWPRSIADCVTAAGTCDDLAACNEEEWRLRFER
jgi:hypothetical protein